MSSMLARCLGEAKSRLLSPEIDALLIGRMEILVEMGNAK